MLLTNIEVVFILSYLLCHSVQCNLLIIFFQTSSLIDLFSEQDGVFRIDRLESLVTEVNMAPQAYSVCFAFTVSILLFQSLASVQFMCSLYPI